MPQNRFQAKQPFLIYSTVGNVMADRILNVLFLCTGNSARSIMAEGLLNKYANGRFNSFSAGSCPTGVVNPHALERLELEGISLPDARSKSWEEFGQTDSPALDFVITVCDNAANEVCPVWPGQPINAHWGVFDPAASEEHEKRIAFAKAFAILERRIFLFTSLPMQGLERMVLEHKVRAIGETVS
jgi:arsenate reductase